jgi:hypothetical protein
MSMGKRQRISGDEQDAFSRFGRRYLCYLQRSGVRAEVKRKVRRRERHTAKLEARNAA